MQEPPAKRRRGWPRKIRANEPVLTSDLKSIPARKKRKSGPENLPPNAQAKKGEKRRGGTFAGTSEIEHSRATWEPDISVREHEELYAQHTRHPMDNPLRVRLRETKNLSALLLIPNSCAPSVPTSVARLPEVIHHDTEAPLEDTMHLVTRDSTMVVGIPDPAPPPPFQAAPSTRFALRRVVLSSSTNVLSSPNPLRPLQAPAVPLR
jgi:hypothetical protein